MHFPPNHTKVRFNGRKRNVGAGRKLREIRGARFALPFAAIAGAVLWLMPLGSPAVAGQLASPTGDVLLVVGGEIENTNNGDEAHFDREMLRALGMTEIVTRTPWHEKDTKFEGVLAHRVMKAVGARGTSLRATAANDYSVSLPLADFTSYDILFAMHIDGEALRLRTKGPIWVIYPEGTDLPAHSREERMIWQLVKLYVE